MVYDIFVLKQTFALYWSLNSVQCIVWIYILFLFIVSNIVSYHKLCIVTRLVTAFS